jgi:hypothetical protein
MREVTYAQALREQSSLGARLSLRGASAELLEARIAHVRELTCGSMAGR